MANAAQIEQLRKMCQVTKANAIEALKESSGDVEEAFRLLVVAGAVIPEDLDPDHCTDAHYGLARLPRTIENRSAASPEQKEMWEAQRPIADLRKQLAGKTPPDAKTIESGATFREIHLRRKHPELAKQKKKKAPTWKHAKLGTFKCDGTEVIGNITIPGFGAFGNRRKPAKLQLEFYVEREGAGPTNEQIAVVLKVQQNAKALAKTICHAMWEDFQGRGRPTGMWWHGHLDEVNPELEPRLAREADLLGALEPYAMRVRTAKGKQPMVLVDFHATFEDEHGVGVLTDGKKVLGIGYAFDVTPYRDGGRASQKAGR